MTSSWHPIRPPTVAEERFLNEVIIHFQLGWHFAREKAFLTDEAMEADIRSFFSLPIPHAVGTQSKETRNPAFVRYVDECLAKRYRGQPNVPFVARLVNTERPSV